MLTIVASLIGQTVNLQQHVMREREGLLEQQQIIRALARANGIQAKAAALLGITPRQLGYRLRKYGIVRAFQVPGEAVALGA